MMKTKNTSVSIAAPRNQAHFQSIMVAVTAAVKATLCHARNAKICCGAPEPHPTTRPGDIPGPLSSIIDIIEP
jgi:hypothetical protein